MPVIGFVHSGSPDPTAKNLAVFRQALAEGGFAEGRNVAIEFRWAEGRFDRLPAQIAELVQRRVSVIAAISPPVAAAAKTANTTIPIVFLSGLDPVKTGLVASLNRPGGNLTGVYIFASDLGPKQLGLLAELVPPPALIAALINPDNPDAQVEVADITGAAASIGRQVLFLRAKTDAAIEAAFATMVERRVGALYVGTGAYFTDRRALLVALAERHRIPAVHQFREAAAAGALMSYGTSLAEGYRQAGIYVARILKGEKPADLPVVQSTKFELVINMRTARALGLTLPPSMLVRADEVLQ